MPSDDAILTLIKAKNSAVEELLYRQWVVYAQLDESFDEFKSHCIRKPSRSSKAIMKDVYGYIELFNQGYKKVEM